MPMVSKLKDFLQALYEYFPNSPKHHLEFTKCAKIVKIEQLKVFQLLKHVWEKYKMLITNMVIDYSSMESTKANLLNLIGIDTIIGFT
jgi:Fe2+ or Zn2+ uptake regulation protein